MYIKNRFSKFILQSLELFLTVIQNSRKYYPQKVPFVYIMIFYATIYTDMLLTDSSAGGCKHIWEKLLE